MNNELSIASKRYKTYLQSKSKVRHLADRIIVCTAEAYTTVEIHYRNGGLMSSIHARESVEVIHHDIRAGLEYITDLEENFQLLRNLIEWVACPEKQVVAQAALKVVRP